MLVSTFELLVKPQLPANITSPPLISNLSRTVIQGYFLNIANVTNTAVTLSLAFTAVTPNIDINQTFTILDAINTNVQGDLTPDPAVPGGIRARFNNLTIAANDTIQFILQPDILRNNGELLNTQNFELRGYVEIFLPVNSPTRIASLLVTPEQRATFFKALNAGGDPQLDQIIYNLPTPNGGSLFTITRE